MSKVKIDKGDDTRVLLTELLPYEVPMLFSNDGLYNLVKGKKFEKFFNKINKKPKYRVPFNYEVRKSVSGETRILSIIHPLNQVAFIDFYKKYHPMIIHLCNKSPFSLRKVAGVAKCFYAHDFVFEEDAHKSEEVEVEPEVLGPESRLFKSYFIYKPIDLIYKFYDRHQYRRLEQRFDFMMEFDISKCFYNIYTHSIAWAVKDKESAKRNLHKDSFENKFDDLMQKANYNETNGIVVGPEVSRIFAEIILQQIDVNVLMKLKKNKLKYGVDFEIRRYVDDYFIFSNDENTLDTIKKTYKRELEEYKLYLNVEKTQIKPIPFLTDIAVGKRELKHLLDELFNRLVVSEEVVEKDESTKRITKLVPQSLKHPYNLSNNFIKDYQCIIKRNSLTYDILSKDIIRYLKRKLVRILKENALGQEKNDIIENFFLLLLDIAFYAYSLNITSSSTFKLAQMIVFINKFLENQDEDLKQNIFSKIFNEADFVMTIFQRKSKVNETNVETLNLLIALKKLGDNYLITEKKLRELFELSDQDNFSKLNYFHIITLLYYIGNSANYPYIKSNLESLSIRKFENEIAPFEKAELTMLFFDFLSCPFISKEVKKELITAARYPGKDPNVLIKAVVKEGSWFMNWDTDIDLERVLKKKEWGSSY